MTYRKALKIIRRNTRKGDGLIDTFKIICQNRYCHPVSDWAKYDLAKLKSLSPESARRLYDRHLARLHEIFRVRL